MKASSFIMYALTFVAGCMFGVDRLRDALLTVLDFAGSF